MVFSDKVLENNFLLQSLPMRDRMRCQKAGFTLSEIMISLAIVAVLAGIATPVYFSTMEKSRANEAIINLNIIHMGQKIYRINNGVYWNGGAATASSINAALSIDISAAYYTNFNIAANGGTSYSATCTRNTTSGGGGTKWYRYDYTYGNAKPDQSEGGSF